MKMHLMLPPGSAMRDALYSLGEIVQWGLKVWSRWPLRHVCPMLMKLIMSYLETQLKTMNKSFLISSFIELYMISNMSHYWKYFVTLEIAIHGNLSVNVIWIIIMFCEEIVIYFHLRCLRYYVFRLAIRLTDHYPVNWPYVLSSVYLHGSQPR